jgi:hypothetical protein
LAAGADGCVSRPTPTPTPEGSEAVLGRATAASVVEGVGRLEGAADATNAGGVYGTGDGVYGGGGGGGGGGGCALVTAATYTNTGCGSFTVT